MNRAGPSWVLYDVAAMNCPGCGSEMQHLALDGKLGTTVAVDVCATCRVIWFDHLKELQLAPAATLRLFSLISEASAAPVAPLPATLRCPRCRARLALTHDMQRATRFQYWRCEAEHGRLIAFVDFLREKDFVRPLTGEQIAELRQTVRTVNCGNCGAPIDLVKDSVCAHCGSPVSILDPAQMARTIAELQGAADPGPRPPAFDALMEAMKAQPESEPTRGMFDIGLRVLSELVKSR